MRILSAIVASLFSLAVLSAEPDPAASANYSEGKDYIVLAEPLRTADPKKIEVAEAFAYPCHACFSFEPLLTAWFKKQKTDIVLVKTHVAFRAAWVPYQRGYYTLLGLGVKENITMDVFNAIHRDHKELNHAEAWAEFLTNYGVDKQMFISRYDSFAVSSQMKQADARTAGYRIDSTPTLIIEGKYKVSNKLGGYQESLKVAQFLVDKVRTERGHR